MPTFIFLFVFVAVFIFGCSEKPAVPPEKITIAVPTHLAATPVFIAFSKGFFKENGLDANLQKHTTGKASLDAVLEGKADMAVMAEFPFMYAVMSGRDVGIIATITTTEGHIGIAGRKDKGISKPDDLADKKIGITFGTNHIYFLHMFLSGNGIDEEKINKINLKQEQMLDAIRNGDVDAVCAQMQYIKGIQKAMGDKAEIFTSKLYLETFNVAGMKDFVTKNPETIKKIIRALLKAEEFIRKKPEDSKIIMAEALKIDKLLINEVWAGYHFKLGLKHYLLSVIESQSRWLIRSRLTDRKKIPNYLDYIIINGLNAVSPESVDIRTQK